MSIVEEIDRLVKRGDYLEATNLVDKHKITDCRSICQNLEIAEITEAIDHSLSILTSLEARIQNYESELRSVKDAAFQMEEREQAVQVQCNNITDTCKLIKQLIDNLTIPDQVQKVLLNGDLNDEIAIIHMEESLITLEKALQYNPDESLQNMRCVVEQKRHAHSIRAKFSDRFYQHFTDYVDQLLSQFSESFINNIYSQAISMPGHDVIHNNLKYLEPLTSWIRTNDRSTYQALRNSYTDRSKTQYDREFKIFFECVKEKMTTTTTAGQIRHHGRVSELSAESRKRNSIVTGDGSTRASSLSGGGTMDTQDTVSGKSSEISYTGWDEFDAYIENILLTIEPTCRSEQSFYSLLFPSFDAQNNDVIDKLVLMFNALKTEFIEFVNYYNNQNGLYSLYLLVRLSKHNPVHSNSQQLFLAHIYSEILIRVKRNFDSFMERQLNSIRDFKPPKQSKCGVIGVVKNFEQFATQVELLVKSTGVRRKDIDRWYPELVAELFRTIDKLEHAKTPSEMIRLENYYYLNDMLRSKKIPCLEAQQKEANLQYNAALNDYVTLHFGQPLKKLNDFFDGVQMKIAEGVKEEEISYQLDFSKQKLRERLQMVNLKEVRKGLEEMYRRIEKHVYEPNSSNSLIQVIWRAMQTEFLSQYEKIQTMIERCYPSTSLSLTFTIDDLLGVFSDIAQSH